MTMLFIAQNYLMAFVLVNLAVILGILAICIPRPRKPYVYDKKKVKRRRPKV